MVCRVTPWHRNECQICGLAAWATTPERISGFVLPPSQSGSATWAPPNGADLRLGHPSAWATTPERINGLGTPLSEAYAVSHAVTVTVK